MRENRRTYGADVVLPSLVEAPEQAKNPLQVRDAPFNTGPEPLCETKVRIGFTHRLFLGAFSFLGNRYDVDLLVQLLDRRHVLVVSFVGRDALWIVTEQFLVTSQCRFDQFMFVGFLFKDVIVCNEFAFDLLDLNHVSPLDRLGSLTPLEQLGMGFEDAEYFLVIRNLFAIQNSTRSLVDDSKPKSAVVGDLVAQRPLEVGRTPFRVTSFDVLTNIVSSLANAGHLLNKPFIQGSYRLLRSRLFGDLASDLGVQFLDLIRLKTPSAYALRAEFTRLLDEAR